MYPILRQLFLRQLLIYCRLLGASLGIATLLISCKAPADSSAGLPPATSPSAGLESCRRVEHQLGTTEICGQPQRIVVLGPYLLEQVLSLGGQPAGFGDHVAFHLGDYDNPKQQIPYLGDRITTQPVNVGLAYQPSIEAILRVQPDLILSPEYNTGQYAAFSQIAPTLILNVAGGQTHLLAIGRALNRSQQAEDLITATKERIASARQQFQPVVSQHPKILLLTSEDAQSFSLVSDRNSFCGSLIKDLGFQLIYPAGVGESALQTPVPVSLEALPQLNAADSILLFGYSWDTATLKGMNGFDGHQLKPLQQAWEANAIAQSLDASKAGRVYFIPAYLCLGLPGPIGTELYLEKLKALLLPSEE
jgi:iron complex transport system substrate-binding protein